MTTTKIITLNFKNFTNSKYNTVQTHLQSAVSGERVPAVITGEERL
jgi:hypothetical protein